MAVNAYIPEKSQIDEDERENTMQETKRQTTIKRRETKIRYT